MRVDPVLATLIKQVGPCRLADIPDVPPFMALAEAIASQQLSVKAADVFPADDLGLVKAAQRAYRLRHRPTKQRLLKMAEAWRPYRSLAAWYLWRSLSLPQVNGGQATRRTRSTRRMQVKN